ncbi:MAG: hypothetical protein P1V97_26550 [Planctomycetota bacterium]|nr:hypothetical protein [Planctomycetota bacterium]
MDKLRECRLIVRTGEQGTEHDVIVKINGVRLVARKLAGGTDSGETMLSKLFIASVVHSLTISHAGPGAWDVDYVEVFGLMESGQVEYLKVQPEENLGDGREIRIWKDTPPPVSEEPTGFAV